MKALKYISSITMLSFVMVAFSQCSSTKKLQEKAPMTLGDVYCQRWIAGVQGGGSGLNIFIPAQDNAIMLDSVYFRGQVTKLEFSQNNKPMYVGRFLTSVNQRRDINMNADAKAEYGNIPPAIDNKIPFELKDNECVVSYKKGKKTKYFKIGNIVEKDLIPYPSAPPNRQ